MEIDEETWGGLKGVRGGMNVGIWFGEEVVGVIGIRGEGEEIGDDGEVVKMGGEVVLEECFVVEGLEWGEGKE
ncbi:sugar diacid recognition domain-containing protein, partial [Bacillus altitudinis]|uniref:sugar diacid recognition domain-containing protein n=1 Tax=Bacillus altitudinis TaxID=293387 RepID=UPI0023567249